MEVALRTMIKNDWPQIAEIYKQGIKTRNATFETEIPTWDKWNSTHIQNCRIVATIENLIVGWAALVPVSARKVYSGVGEISIYISNKFKGQRIGTKLLEKLIVESENEGFWTLQSVIFPENTISIKMHQDNGFRIVGYREKIGQLDGIWRNTILLERRSNKIGLKPNI
jgi:L-amino acid N-acyltransferase YncA